MFVKRCLQVLAVLLMVALSGEGILAKGDTVSGNSGRDGGVAQEENPKQMSRMELQADLMRFAQTFVRGFTQKIRSLERQGFSKEMRFEISSAELRTINILVDIATGPDAVDNLLDMVVFVTLSRAAVEKRWGIEVLGKNKAEIETFFKQMEKEIWAIAGMVLTPRHQKELRNLIRHWLAQHPDEHYIQEVGFHRLTGIMGESYFKDAGKPGFILPEMGEATRSIDEARNLAERVSFFAKYLPFILRATAETGIYGVLNEPETVQLLSDIQRLTAAIEEIGAVVKQFPDLLSKQRQELMDDLLKSEGKLKALSGEIQKSLAMGDEMAASATEAAGSITRAATAIDKILERIQSLVEPESLDITRWFETIHEVTEAAKQTQALVTMTDTFLTHFTADIGLNDIKKGVDALLLRAFVWAVLLIVFFFLVLLGYRLLSIRLLRGTSV